MPRKPKQDPIADAKKAAASPIPPRPRAGTSLLDSSGQHLTPAGARYVEDLARAAAPQGFVASQLGISAKAFRKMMNDENDQTCRLAFEAGQSSFEFEVTQILLDSARGGFAAAGMFLAKTRLGWSENAPPPTSNNITLILPRPLSAEEYAKRQNERAAIEAEFTPVVPEPLLLPRPVATRPVEPESPGQMDVSGGDEYRIEQPHMQTIISARTLR